MRSTTPEPVGASESSCIHMPFCGWLVSVSNLRSQYQSWLGRSPCSLHHALWLRPLARKSSILSAHNSRSSCLAFLVTRISSFSLMTSLSHQRRGARRYGWFDAYCTLHRRLVLGVRAEHYDSLPCYLFGRLYGQVNGMS